MNTILLAWSETMALSGTSSASTSPPNSCSAPEQAGLKQLLLIIDDGAAAQRAGARG